MSVIIPSFNAAQTLGLCLQSLRDQSFSDFEVIVVDDGSTDGTDVVVRSFSADSRYRYVRKKNGGVSSARNHGMDLATGEWIAFVDADDTVGSDYIKHLYEGLETTDHCKSSLVIAGFICISDAPLRPQKKVSWSKRIVRADDKANAYLDTEVYKAGAPFAKLYSLQLVRENAIRFDERLAFGEDLIFMLGYMSVVGSIVFVEACDYNYFCKTSSGLSKRYATFEHEYVFFRRFVSGSGAILSSAGSNVAHKELEASFLLRALTCLYRPATKCGRSARLDVLQKISSTEAATLATAKGLWASLMRFGMFRTLDSVFLVTYELRYTVMAKPWAWICYLRS